MTEENSIRIQISFYKDGELAEEKVSNLSRMEQRLVTEGGNILLLRLLMIEKRALGDMELKTVTFTGAVVKNKYVSGNNGRMRCGFWVSMRNRKMSDSVLYFIMSGSIGKWMGKCKG